MVGASTWALGSHKWRVNRGSLTKKERIIQNKRKFLSPLRMGDKKKVNMCFIKKTAEKNKGMEQKTV